MIFDDGVSVRCKGATSLGRLDYPHVECVGRRIDVYSIEAHPNLCAPLYRFGLDLRPLYGCQPN